MKLFVTVVIALMLSVSFNATAQPSLTTSYLTPSQAKAYAGDLYLVYFEEKPLASYDGNVPGLRATSAKTRGETKLNARSADSQAYISYLHDQQALHISAIENRLNRNLNVTFRYVAVANGIATILSPAEVNQVRQSPGVTAVVHDTLHQLDTDRGPTWIGAPGIWNGTDTNGLPATQGEGVIIGVIDSGVNMDHPSFAATGGDGYEHINPFGSGVFVGWCDPVNPNFDPSYPCNDKLIGGWDYTDIYCAANPGVCSETDGPEDDNGHGSHTASTAGGNVLLSPAISGVAPHANLITYDACYTDAMGMGSCAGSSLSAALDQAALDGVDVTNYSISGGTNPWNDLDTLFLVLSAAGVYPAASAGNSGPTANTVAHLGPWVSTTAASTHDRATAMNELINMSGGDAPPADMTGASATLGYGPASVVLAGDSDNGDPNPEQCLNPFPPGTWTGGEIVLCDRGTIARVQKCQNVSDGGAAGCILANADNTQGAPAGDAHVIPAIHVDFPNGEILRSWLASGTGHTATITDSVGGIDPALGDIMADFSSRGPNTSFDVLKPDVSAPGVNILAAGPTDGTTTPPEFLQISGTSMSSPHNAGAGALMTALYPSWSSSAIKSALMMSAVTDLLKEDGITAADPFDIGGGRIDLSKAAKVGMILDETTENYEAANPALGGDPGSLNLASLQSNSCVVECSWTRTFTSVSSSTLNWTVSSTTRGGVNITATPNAFSLGPGATQEVEFTLNHGGAPLGAYLFAEVQLTEPGSSPDLHIPVAVQPGASNLPELVTIETYMTNDSLVLEDLVSAVAITDLDIQLEGLVQATVTDISLDQDPTNAAPYDDLGQVFVKTVNIPAGTSVFVASTVSDESPDVDLFVGTGAVPSLATQICSSTSSTATENCEVLNPTAGTHWILVQNWSGSDSQPDLIVLTDSALPSAPVGNFDVTGPMIVPPSTPYSLTINWNEPAFSEGETWLGAFDVGTDSGNPGNIGTVALLFKILETPLVEPGDFSKTNPADASIDQSTISILKWASSVGAAEYEYCLDTVDNDSCDSAWISRGSGTNAAPDNLSALTTYYWQVRAINEVGTTEANEGAWWSFITSAIDEGVFRNSFELVPVDP